MIIAGLEVSVRELRVKDIRQLQALLSKGDETPVIDLIEKHLLPKCVVGLDSFDELTVSEAMQLWEAFKEANQSFLKIILALQSGKAQSLFL